MSTTDDLRALRFLAALYGAQSSYHGMGQRRFSASAEALLLTLRALGASCARMEDAPAALTQRRQELWRRALPLAVAAWEGQPPAIHARVPAAAGGASWTAHLTLETGETRAWRWAGADLPTLEAVEVAGERYVLKGLTLPPPALPLGYHRLRLEISGQAISEALIIAAPLRAWEPPEGARAWGAFMPLYALNGGQGWGHGSYPDLAELSRWVARRGGSLTGTLPLLPALLSQEPGCPFEYSPYSPVSRLLWNEFFADPGAAPELAQSREAQNLIQSPEFQQELAELRRSPLVDYRRGMSLQRRVLELLAEACFDSEASRAELQRFVLGHPAVNDYARFRAVMERQGAAWQRWPERMRQGVLGDGDFDESVRRYYLYSQWLAHRQLAQAAETGKAEGARLYLDLPLGVHPDGYDVWRWQSLFVNGVSVGAPPEPVYPQGQNWGFPPPHPEQLRRDGYRYFIAYLRHHLRAAGALRIDHVMGLHRLFWIPQELDGRHGVYVRYPQEDFYAILALESQRHKTVIVGEDLGIVPPEVRPALRRHGLLGTYVAYFNVTGGAKQAINSPSAHDLACVNTHDMPTFAAYCQGLDLEKQIELGFHTPESAARELARRRAAVAALVEYFQQKGLLPANNAEHDSAPADCGNGTLAAPLPAAAIPDLLRALLRWLAASDAPMLLINLEDLWGEEQPQNIPGTGQEQPSWRRKARHNLEEFARLPQAAALLAEINQTQQESGAKQAPAPRQI